MKVTDIMVKNVVTIDANKNVMEAALLMSERNVGCLLVEEEGKVKGIITERDIVRRVVALAVDPTKVKVKDVMSTPLVVIGPEANVEDAAKAMVIYRVRRLPVVKEGRLLGLVSATDLVKYLTRLGVSGPILDALMRRREPPEGGPYA